MVIYFIKLKIWVLKMDYHSSYTPVLKTLSLSTLKSKTVSFITLDK